jgi:HTH-type transcriptional regulator/antitoxin HigA
MEGMKPMTTRDIATVERAWPSLAPILFVPHSEHEYKSLVRALDMLIDMIGEDESHPLASLMEVIGVLIEKYEDEHVPEIDVL